MVVKVIVVVAVKTCSSFPRSVQDGHASNACHGFVWLPEMLPIVLLWLLRLCVCSFMLWITLAKRMLSLVGSMVISLCACSFSPPIL